MESSGAASAVERSLKCEHHLACVEGVDCGLVLPLVEGERIGRGRGGVTDRYVSRSHATVRFPLETRPQRAFSLRSAGPRTIALLTPTQPTNPLTTGNASLPLRLGKKIRLGESVWQVRGRPTDLSWPARTKRKNRSGWLRFTAVLMPIMMVAFLARWLPDKRWLLALGGIVLLAVWIFLVVRRRRARKWDAARLSQSLVAAQPTLAKLAPEKTMAGTSDWEDQEEVVVRASPEKPGTLSLGSRPLGVVGDNAGPYAHWLAAQAATTGRAVRVLSPGEEDPGEDVSGALVIAWARAPSELPTFVTRIIGAKRTGGMSWAKQIAETLDDGATLPDTCPFDSVLGSPAPALLKERWSSPRSRFLIGRGGEGTVEFDLLKDGPHALVAGGTGSGKSEFLTTLVLSYAATLPPSKLRFIFIDYKGGAGLSHLADLPHVDHSITDLDGSKTPWLLRALGAALTVRKIAAANLGFRSWEEWEQYSALADSDTSGGFPLSSSPAPPPPPPPPRLVIVVDEFRVLADSHPDLMRELTDITTQGRSLGMHLVIATQRPGGAVSPNMRATLDLRFALRCAEPADSIETIGDPSAAALPRIPGRAILDGNQVQTAFADNIETWKTMIMQATAQDEGRWMGGFVQQVPDPLPDEIPHALDLDDQVGEAGTLGMLEDPVSARLRVVRATDEPTVFLGPASHRTELLDLALSAALTPTGRQKHAGGLWNRPLLWVGEFPEAAAHCAPAFAKVVSPTNLGEAAETLSRVADAAPTDLTLVVADATTVFRRLEMVGGSEEAKTLLRRLLAASQSREPASGLRLILTDTKPSAEIGEIPNKVFRLPTKGALARPELLALLPSPEGSGHASSALSRYVSGLPRRTLAAGFQGEAAWMQVASPPTSLTPHSPQPKTSAPLTSPRLELSLQWAESNLIEGKVTVIAPNHLHEEISKSLSGGAKAGLEAVFLSPQQWPELSFHRDSHLFCFEPNRETLRFLTAQFPHESLWLLASYPFPQGEGLYAEGNTISRLSLRNES